MPFRKNKRIPNPPRICVDFLSSGGEGERNMPPRAERRSEIGLAGGAKTQIKK